MGIRLQSVLVITMKFLVGVLAIAVSAYGYGLPGNSYTHVDRLHKREAEADPQVFANGALPYGYGNTAFPYGTAPAAFTGLSPVVYNSVPVATAPAAPVFAPYTIPAIAPAGVAVAARPFTPHDCVTADGCAVRALKEAGLAKREADPEAEAEAEAEAAYYYGNYYNRYARYNPYYNYYNGFYNRAYNYGYSGYGYPYAYNPYVAAPVAVKAAEPIEVEVKAAPVPLVAAPAY